MLHCLIFKVQEDEPFVLHLEICVPPLRQEWRAGARRKERQCDARKLPILAEIQDSSSLCPLRSSVGER